MAKKSKYQSLRDIKLENPPLVEAWFTIHWATEPVGERLPLRKGTGFNLAVGRFYELVKARFSDIEELDASQLPEQIATNVPRYRFHPADKMYPLLQLGTAMATVNYVDDYDWEKLKIDALYLREKLMEAYSNKPLNIALLSLRYRNAIHFEYGKEDMLDFLGDHLHTKIKTPVGIPGDFAARQSPAQAAIALTYDLSTPLAKGILNINTGSHKVGEEEIESFIVDTEILSMENMELYKSEDNFSQWLEDAHAVTYDWFFALIEDKLIKQYKPKQG